MPKRMFEFRCVKGHAIDRFVDTEVMVVECPHCRNDASRIISSPRIALEGLTGAFPDAAAKWARLHEQAAKRHSES